MRIKAIFSALILLAAPLTVQADESAKQALQNYLSSIQHFQAQFEQTVVDEQGEIIQQASGSMAMAHPNRFNWQVTEPDEELMVADGNALWIFNPFLEQVTILDLHQALEQSPFMLLISDDQSAWQRYQITALENGFSVTPLMPQLIAEIRIQLDGKMITSLQLHDSQGKVSTFALSQFNAEEKPNNELFSFTPPADIDIDDQREQYR